MFQNDEWIDKKDYNIIVIIKETTPEKTKLTIDSLFSTNDNELNEFDYNIPLSSNIDISLPIYLLGDNDYGIKNVSNLNDFDSTLKDFEQNQVDSELNEFDLKKTESNKTEQKKLYIYMSGGYYSIPFIKLNEIVKNISEPTLFKTIPYGYNFYTENAFVIPSKEFHSNLIDLSLKGKITLNENIIGIDKMKYLKFFEHELLNPVRTAFSLNTNIKYCFHGIDKLKQLSRARYSINLKYKDLRKSLKSKITKDKTLNNYIRLLKSFENSCSKYDYIFYCMMNYPSLYEKTINIKLFIPSLMDIDPNQSKNRTLYDLLVDYTLYNPN